MTLNHQTSLLYVLSRDVASVERRGLCIAADVIVRIALLMHDSMKVQHSVTELNMLADVLIAKKSCVNSVGFLTTIGYYA